MMDNPDLFFLQKALELAKLRQGFCAPNPAVGAILVDINGNIVAEGFHYAAGSEHAEIDALNKCAKIKNDMTLYVTLEPCCHWGKTPPCTQALIKAGIKRVVYGYRDPNPVVAGKGEQQLCAVGIDCHYIYCKEITLFYRSYSYWLQYRKPFVTAKIAMTLNGKIAKRNGSPLAITGKEINGKTHQYRRQSDAILTTVKTINNDNPQLNIRNNNEIIAKKVYVIDRELKIRSDATIFSTAQSIVLFYSQTANFELIKKLEHKNINFIAVNETNEGLDLNQILFHIGQDGIHDLWVEAGGKLFSALITQKLAKKIIFYLAPKLEEGLSAFDELALDFNDAVITWKQYGNDVMGEFERED
jgi:diaminohydroxyphosphoribosylaminopyrimidine deaminase/5-amino-6-(5-phosphoribosylamino)uracil reductase